jgi:predicted Zn-dependent peptidase
MGTMGCHMKKLGYFLRYRKEESYGSHDGTRDGKYDVDFRFILAVAAWTPDLWGNQVVFTNKSNQDDAMKILRERFARGEISEEEFEAKKRKLKE